MDRQTDKEKTAGQVKGLLHRWTDKHRDIDRRNNSQMDRVRGAD
jgi:hypothetical protein